MSSEKIGKEEAEQILNSVQERVVRPLLNHFSAWDGKPVDRIFEVNDVMPCYK